MNIKIMSFSELFDEASALPADADVIDALKQIPQAEYPPELLAARRIALLSAYGRLTPEAQEAVCNELAALDVAGQDDGETNGTA